MDDKSGAPGPEEYISEEALKRFEPIANNIKRLSRFKGDGQVNPENLAVLTTQLLQFQDEYFGRNKSTPENITRVPMSLFRDFSSTGPLRLILLTCLDFKMENQIKNFNFRSKRMWKTNVELLVRIRSALQNARMLKQPMVFLSSNVPDRLRGQLEDIVNTHDGVIVSNESEATHIVEFHPELDDDENGGKDDDEDYCRTLEFDQDKSMARVHWWFYPDSYDEWISADRVSGEIEEQKTPPSSRRVTCRFILDLQKFNEWMNEDDYEIDETNSSNSDKQQKKSSKKSKKQSDKHKKNPEKTSKTKTPGKSEAIKQLRTPKSSKPPKSETKRKTREESHSNEKSPSTISKVSTRKQTKSELAITETPILKSKKAKHEASTHKSTSRKRKVMEDPSQEEKEKRHSKEEETPQIKIPSGKKSEKKMTSKEKRKSKEQEKEDEHAITPVIAEFPKGKKSKKVAVVLKFSEPSLTNSIASSEDEAEESYITPTPKKKHKTDAKSRKDSSTKSNLPSSEKHKPSKVRITIPATPNLQRDAEAIVLLLKRVSNGWKASSVKGIDSKEVEDAPIEDQVQEEQIIEGKTDTEEPRLSLQQPPNYSPIVSPSRQAKRTKNKQTESVQTSSTPTASTVVQQIATQVQPVRIFMESRGVQTDIVQQNREEEKNEEDFPVALPSCALWFDMDSVHSIERQMLPEFFKVNSVQSEIYMQTRNFIVDLYRENPRVYLTATACRRSLAGNVCTIMRIHEFLEHWGIINFHVDPATIPASFAPRPTNALSIRELQSENVLSTHSSWQSKDQTDAMICSVCFVSITGSHYVCQRPKPLFGSGTRLCNQCFGNGYYPPQLLPVDFESVNPEQEWSQEEVLNLLKAVEAYQDDWDAIARAISSKTKEECMLKFVQLPIEHMVNITETIPIPSQPIVSHIAAISVDAPNTDISIYRGVHVQTPFGNGTVSHIDGSGHAIVELPWGTLYTTRELISCERPSESSNSQSVEMLKQSAKVLSIEAEKKLQELEIKAVELQIEKVQHRLDYINTIEKALCVQQIEVEQIRNHLLNEMVIANLHSTKESLSMDQKDQNQDQNQNQNQNQNQTEIFSNISSDNVFDGEQRADQSNSALDTSKLPTDQENSDAENKPNEKNGEKSESAKTESLENNRVETSLHPQNGSITNSIGNTESVLSTNGMHTGP